MSKKERQFLDLKMWVMVGMFFLSFSSSVGSYFKTMSDLRHEIQNSLYSQANTLRKEIRQEMKEEYASKEETKFIQKSLAEIQSQLHLINQKLDRR